VSPAEGTVAPFGEVELDVTLDARGLAPGPSGATIVVRSNDPERPVVEVPVEMTVVGLPDIAVPGERTVLESIEDFTDAGATTSHTLSVASPAGGAKLELIAEGDFGSASEVARILVDGVDFGAVGNTDSDCFPAVGAFALAASDLAGLVSDGAIDVEIANSPTVGTFCVVNRHTVRLSYDTPLEQLNLGTVFLGYERTHPLIIKNDGRAELRVTSIAVDTPEIAVGSSSVTIPPFASVEVPVTYTPLAIGPLAATLAIASNDPDEPELTIEIVAEALEAPAAAVDPAFVEAALPPRGDRVRTETLRLTNTGGSDLVWTTDLFEIFGPPPVAKDWSERPKGDEVDNGAGALAIERTGGPDAFGYQFADSDRPNGPAFDWIDVSESGIPIPISEDDENSGPIRVGFGFPFYGTTHDFVNISTNGWLSFSSEKTSYSNPDSLPNAGFSIPENLIAPFWDDLDPGGAGSIHYLADGSRFIVQYNGVGRFASSAALTFQVVLYPSGKIVFNYLSMLGALDSATIGIQNEDRTIGLLVAYNESYVHDGLAVEIAPIAPWSAVAPASGVLPAGGFTDIEVELSSSELDAGEYLAEVLIRSNDPVNGEIRVPVTLRAAEVELDSFEIRPRIVNTRSRGRTIRASLQLPPAYDPRDVDVSSVSLYGVLFAEHHPVEFADENGDGIEEIILRFDRRRFVQLLPEGEEVAVTISGEVAGEVWFAGTTTVRVGLHRDPEIVSLRRSPDDSR
jgi:hypothetical protein